MLSTPSPTPAPEGAKEAPVIGAPSHNVQSTVAAASMLPCAPQSDPARMGSSDHARLEGATERLQSLLDNMQSVDDDLSDEIEVTAVDGLVRRPPKVPLTYSHIVPASTKPLAERGPMERGVPTIAAYLPAGHDCSNTPLTDIGQTINTVLLAPSVHIPPYHPEQVGAEFQRTEAEMGGLVRAEPNRVYLRVSSTAVPPPPHLIDLTRPEPLSPEPIPSDLPAHFERTRCPIPVTEYNSSTAFCLLDRDGINQYLPPGTAELAYSCYEDVMGENGIVRLGAKSNPKGKGCISCAAVDVKMGSGTIAPVSQATGDTALAKKMGHLVSSILLIATSAMEAILSAEELRHLKAQQELANSVTVGGLDNPYFSGIQINIAGMGRDITQEMGFFGREHFDGTDGLVGGSLVGNLSVIPIDTSKYYPGGIVLVDAATIVETLGINAEYFHGTQPHRPLGAACAPGVSAEGLFRVNFVCYANEKCGSRMTPQGLPASLAFDRPRLVTKDGSLRNLKGFRPDGGQLFGAGFLPAPSPDMIHHPPAQGLLPSSTGPSTSLTPSPYSYNQFRVRADMCEPVPTGDSPLAALYADPFTPPAYRFVNGQPLDLSTLNPDWTPHHIRRARQLKLANGDPVKFAALSGRAGMAQFCALEQTRIDEAIAASDPDMWEQVGQRRRYEESRYRDPRFLQPLPPPAITYFPDEPAGQRAAELLKIHRAMQKTFLLHPAAAAAEAAIRAAHRLANPKAEVAPSPLTVEAPVLDFPTRLVKSEVLALITARQETNEQMSRDQIEEDSEGEEAEEDQTHYPSPEAGASSFGSDLDGPVLPLPVPSSISHPSSFAANGSVSLLLESSPLDFAQDMDQDIISVTGDSRPNDNASDAEMKVADNEDPDQSESDLSELEDEEAEDEEAEDEEAEDGEAEDEEAEDDGSTAQSSTKDESTMQGEGEMECEVQEDEVELESMILGNDDSSDKTASGGHDPHTEQGDQLPTASEVAGKISTTASTATAFSPITEAEEKEAPVTPRRDSEINPFEEDGVEPSRSEAQSAPEGELPALPDLNDDAEGGGSRETEELGLECGRKSTALDHHTKSTADPNESTFDRMAVKVNDELSVMQRYHMELVGHSQNSRAILTQAGSVIGLLNSRLALRREQTAAHVKYNLMDSDSPQWNVFSGLHSLLLHQEQQEALFHISEALQSTLQYYSRVDEALLWKQVEFFRTWILPELIAHTSSSIDEGFGRGQYRGPVAFFDLAEYAHEQAGYMASSEAYSAAPVEQRIIDGLTSTAALGSHLPATSFTPVWLDQEGAPRLGGGQGGAALSKKLRAGWKAREADDGRSYRQYRDQLLCQLAEDIVVIPVVQQMISRAYRRSGKEAPTLKTRTETLAQLRVRSLLVSHILEVARDHGFAHPQQLFALHSFCAFIRTPQHTFLLLDSATQPAKRLYRLANGASDVLEDVKSAVERFIRGRIDAEMAMASLKHLADGFSALMQRFQGKVVKGLKRSNKRWLDEWIVDKATHPYELEAIFANESILVALKLKPRNPNLYEWIAQDPDRRLMFRDYGPTEQLLIRNSSPCVDLKVIHTILSIRLSSFGCTSPSLYSRKPSAEVAFNTMEPIIYGPSDYPAKVERAIRDGIIYSNPCTYGSWSDTAQHAANAKSLAFFVDWMANELKKRGLDDYIGGTKPIPYEKRIPWNECYHLLVKSGIRGAGGKLLAGLISSDLAGPGGCVQHGTAADYARIIAFGAERGQNLMDLSIDNPATLDVPARERNLKGIHQFLSTSLSPEIQQLVPVHFSDIENNSCKLDRASKSSRLKPLMGLKRLGYEGGGLINRSHLEGFSECFKGQHHLAPIDMEPDPTFEPPDFATLSPIPRLPSPLVPTGVKSLELPPGEFKRLYSSAIFEPAGRSKNGGVKSGAPKRKKKASPSGPSAKRAVISDGVTVRRRPASAPQLREPTVGKDEEKEYGLCMTDAGEGMDGSSASSSEEEEEDELDSEVEDDGDLGHEDFDECWEEHSLAGPFDPSNRTSDRSPLRVDRLLARMPDPADQDVLRDWIRSQRAADKAQQDLNWALELTKNARPTRRWLSGRTIDDYGDLIMARERERDSLSPGSRLVILDTGVMRVLNGEKNYPMPRERHELWRSEAVIAPVVVQNHWFLIYALPQSRRCIVVDSLGGERGREARNLTDYIDKQRAGQGDAASTREWEYELSPWWRPVQKNNFDCGVFVCQTMERLAARRPVDFDTQNMTYFRVRMTRELKEGRLRPHEVKVEELEQE